MEFPENLEQGVLLKGMDEFKQTIKLLIKNNKKQFLQNPELGSTISPHTDTEILKLAIRDVVNQVPNTALIDISVDYPTISLTLQYFDQIDKFTFSVKD